MAAVTIHSDFGAQENKVCHCFHCFPIYLPLSDRNRSLAMIFVFWMLRFKPYFKKKINLFNWRLITLQYCGGYCHTSTWISHRCIFVPPSWAPFPPQPQTHLGCPRALALSVLLHALNLYWSSILHIVIYNVNAILSYHLTLAFSHWVQKSILFFFFSFLLIFFNFIFFLNFT